MVTVLAVYNSDGCVGRCDANCYEAVKTKCHCICGGRNHGAGLKKSIENTGDAIGLKPEDVKRFAEAHGYKAEELIAIDRRKMSTKKARRLTKARLQPQEASP